MSVAEIKKSLQRKATGETLTYQRGTIKAPTLFDHLVNSDLPTSDMSVERLASEAQVLMGAGTVTTAQSMSHLVVNVLLQPDVEKRLRGEFAVLMKQLGEASIPPARELEKLPYLQACVKEGLRLSHGLMHRLPRVSPDVALKFKGWTIPPGTPVGMSAYFMHIDETVYEKPREFLPERWLGDIDPRMERNYVPFSRGSRRCLAPNLAYTKISMVMAALLSPVRIPSPASSVR
ncbi:Fusicoccadiene C-8 hydroxylase [Exserohilum turcicum]